MSVKIDISCPDAPATTFDALRIDVTLTNEGTVPVLVAGSEDRSAALTFNLYDAQTGALVRRMNGLSHQRMMSRSRVDLSPDLAPLGAGERLSWTLDLASFHYPLPAGTFHLHASYVVPASGINVLSQRIALSVLPLRLEWMQSVHDNPVTDATALLFATSDGVLRLRQHNHARPLAAWYARDVGPAFTGTAAPFIASASAFNTKSFDHLFVKWLLSAQGSDLSAREYAWGQPTGRVRTAAIPAGKALCRSAFTTASGDIFFFLCSPGLLEAFRLSAAGYVKVFDLALPAGVPEPAVSADEEHIHVVIADRGVVHHRIRLDGSPAGHTRLLSTSMLPHRYVYEAADGIVKAIFLDRRASSSVLLLYSDAQGPTTRFVRLAVRGAVQEIDFDRSAQGRFIVAVSTSRRKLYLLEEERGPTLIATDEDRYHPRVIARQLTYIGHFRREQGYRFAAYSRGRRGPRRVNYELSAWEQP
jgi:hypothetical protein